MPLELVFLAQAFAAILVIVDPVGNVPFFMALTQRLDARQRNSLAWRAPGIAALVLLVFTLTGTVILHIFNVTFPALQIGGGIIMLIIALRILEGRQFAWEDDRGLGGDMALRTSVVPLGIPLMAGPGALATVLVLAERARTTLELLLLLVCIVAVCLLGSLCYRFAIPLVHKLGRTAIVTISSLAGLILAVIAVQFILDGLKLAMPAIFK